MLLVAPDSEDDVLRALMNWMLSGCRKVVHKRIPQKGVTVGRVRDPRLASVAYMVQALV